MAMPFFFLVGVILCKVVVEVLVVRYAHRDLLTGYRCQTDIRSWDKFTVVSTFFVHC